MGAKRLISLLGCALLLCLSLVVCGCSANGENEGLKAFAGDWSLYSMEENGETISESGVAQLRALDMDITLALNEDLTATFVIYGDAEECTWEPVDATKATLNYEEDALEMTLADGKLSFKMGETSLTLVPTSELGAAEDVATPAE